MFVQSSGACSMPNSETPMSQEAIDDQNAFIASVGTAFDDGDAAFNGLLVALGGNPAGETPSGAAGVPTTGTLDTSLPGIPVVSSINAPPIGILPTLSDPASWAWAPSPPVVIPGGGAGWRARQGEHRNPRRYTNRIPPAPQSAGNFPPAGCPTIIPLVTTIPIPETVSIPQPAPPPTNAPAAPAPSAPLPDCRTGNWCLDIRNGCVLSSQVSLEQLEACSQAGYAGNLNMFPAIAAAGGAGGGQFFGTPQPNPPPYTPGMSGLGQDSSAQAANATIFSSAFEYVISGLVTVAAMAIFYKGRKKS